MEQAYPIENEKLEPIVWRLREQVGRQPRMLAFALFGAALCVLLIACANLAGLLLARALSRKRELAVRAALGAGRERLVRQLLTESLLVAALGGLLGIGLAWAAGPIVARVLPDALPFGEVPRVDPRALVFALAATAATGILFGLAPALRARSEAASAGLREDARAGGSRRTERLRSLLVAGEVAASVVLLVGAGLLLRALWEIQGRDPGFRTAGVLTMRTTVPLPRYEPTGERERLYRHVLSRVRELPGVESAAYISSLPMVWRGGIWGANLFENQDPAVRRAVSIRQVTPGYFQTLGIPFRRGRDIAETDGPKAQQVCVVSEAFVQEFALTQPLGQKLKVGFLEPTIVGVVGDVRVRGLERETEPQLYIASAQLPDGAMIGYFPKDLVLRTRSAASGALIPEIRRIVSSADPTVPVSDVRTLEEILRSDTGARRLQARLVAGFAALALLLAAVGIHGLLAYAVSQRTREIGVRVALGARPLQILGLILSSSGRLAGLGILAGAAVAWAFGRALIALLAGISPTDPLTLGAAIGLAVSATLVGSLVPAMRALRIDPARAMRVE
jgi:predicted permease